MTLHELCAKQVIQLENGVCLGHIDDVEIDAVSGKITNMILWGRPKLFGLLGREENLLLPWAEVEKFGVDAVLVNTALPPPADAQGAGFSWLRGKK